jgi:ABC-type antimicrobial peptide transport system permease subunit
VLIGLPLAWFAARGLGGLLVGVPPRDPLALAGGVGVLIGVTIVAAWLPARRVASVHPMETLRSE